VGSRADGNRRGPGPGRARRAVLLRKLADQAGLTAVLGSALTRAGKFPRIDVLHRQHAVVEDGVLPRGSARLLHDVALARHVPGSATDLHGCGARGW